MKIKVDENLPIELAANQTGLGHDVHTVAEEGFCGNPDFEVWQAAQAEGRFLVTQDLDFSDLRAFSPGTHHGILLVRLQSPSRRKLIERIDRLFRTENVNQWTGCFVVTTERKLRIRGLSHT